MSSLSNSPYSLILGDLVVAMVRASNEKGPGQFSGSNTVGALIQRVPLSPVQAPFSGTQTN